MQSLTLLLSVVLVGLAVAGAESLCGTLCTNATIYATIISCDQFQPQPACFCNPTLPANISDCLCPSQYCPVSEIPGLEVFFQSNFCLAFESDDDGLLSCPVPSMGALFIIPNNTKSSSAQNTATAKPTITSVLSDQNAQGPSTTTASATSKVRSSSIGSALATAKPSLPSPTPVSKGLSPRAKAGIAIGVIIGVLIAIVVFLLWRRCRQRKLAANPVAELEVEGRSRHEADSEPIVEADSKKISPDEDTTKHLLEPDTTAIEKANAPTTPVSASQFQAQPYEEHYSSHPAGGGLEQTKFADPPSDRGSIVVGTSGYVTGTSPAAPFESPNPSHERDSLSAVAKEAEKEKLQRQLSDLQEEKERHLRLEEIARQEREVRDRLSALG